MRKIGLGAAAILLAAFVYPALALPSVDVEVDVLTARLVEECGASQTWEVSTEIRVRNTSEQTITFNATDFWAEFNAGGQPGQIQNDVTVVDADGFVAGAQIESEAESVFHPVVRISLPCDTRGAGIFGQVELVGREGAYYDGDDFIENGTQVPMGPSGILATAALLSVAGVLSHRLGRRPRPLELKNHGS